MSGFKDPERDFALHSVVEKPGIVWPVYTLPDALVRASAQQTANAVNSDFYTKLWRPAGELLVCTTFDGSNIDSTISASQPFGDWEETTIRIGVSEFGEVDQVWASYRERVTPPKTFELGVSTRDLSAFRVLGALYKIRSASRRAARNSGKESKDSSFGLNYVGTIAE